MRVWIPLVALWIAVGGCTLTGDEPYALLDGTAPELMETFPADGWRQVPNSIQLRVWFSEALEPGAVHQGNLPLFTGEYLQRSRYRVETTPDGLGLVVIEPLEPLLPGVLYQLWAGPGLSDLNGNPLANPGTVRFTTLR
jgi:hypothetical protein